MTVERKPSPKVFPEDQELETVHSHNNHGEKPVEHALDLIHLGHFAITKFVDWRKKYSTKEEVPLILAVGIMVGTVAVEAFLLNHPRRGSLTTEEIKAGILPEHLEQAEERLKAEKRPRSFVTRTIRRIIHEPQLDNHKISI